MDFTSLGITKELIALRECRMIDMSTDMGHELAFVRRVLPEGLTHYQMVREQRKKFINLRDSADELIGLLVADCDRDVCEIAPRYYEDHESDYRALSKAGLLEISWADNKPYIVQITNNGREYVEGTFSLEETLRIENNPTINNVIYGSSAFSSSHAVAEANNKVTLGVAIQAIIDMDIDAVVKEKAEAALKELDSASKARDKTTFAEKLERAASIAKSTSRLADVMLPFIHTALQQLLA